MAKNKFAQLLYGKVIYIFETELEFDQLSTIFSPSTYWVDVTGLDCEVGYLAEFEDGVGLVLSPPPKIETTIEEQKAQRLKDERAAAVSNIVVEVDGMKFDGDEEAQTRLGRTITAAMALGVDLDTCTQTWVLWDNSIAQPTIKQLAEALKKAGEAQTALWVVPYQDQAQDQE